MPADFKHDQTKPIVYNMPDINGDVPDVTILNRRFRHEGNGKSYLVRGLLFLADVDKWAYEMVETDGDIPLVRTHRNFFGRMSDGRVRFTPIGRG